MDIFEESNGRKEKINLGDKIQRWMEEVYEKPTARLIVNGQLTEIIKLGRGVRQGCPVSPLIFKVGLEMLAIKIRANQQITGLKIQDQE